MLQPINRNTVLALLAGIAGFAVAEPVRAQTPDPVHWTIGARTTPVSAGDTVSLKITAAIDPGFHVYALTQIDDGPYPLVIRAIEDASIKTSGAVRGPKPTHFPTSSFGIPVEWYTTKAVFNVPLRITSSATSTVLARISVRYQSCSKSLCLPPNTIELTQSLTIRTRNTNQD